MTHKIMLRLQQVLCRKARARWKSTCAFTGTALLSLSLLSCSDNSISDPSDSNNTIEENSDPVYVFFKLAGTDKEKTAGTRAQNITEDDFDFGLDSERDLSEKMENHLIMFFDSNGRYVSHNLTALNISSKEDKQNFLSEPVVFSVDLNKIKDMVTYNTDNTVLLNGSFLVFINANPDDINAIINDIKDNKDKDGIEIAVRAGHKVKSTTLSSTDGKQYFTMSSSIVVRMTGNNISVTSAMDENGLYELDADKENLTTTPVAGRALGDGRIKFYRSEKEARLDPIILYVERLASKYSLELPDGEYFNSDQKLIFDKDDFKGITPVLVCDEYMIGQETAVVFHEADWKVNLLGWGLNGKAKEEYAFKTINYTPFSMGYYDGWTNNEYNRIRNFWAEGVYYNKVDRPDQYRSALDETLDSFDPENPDNKDKEYSLNYFKFEDLSKRMPYYYSPEHTWDPSEIFEAISLGTSDPLKYAIVSKDYLRASTHVIVTAQLLINGLEGKEENDKFSNPIIKEDGKVESSTKYYMNGLFWTKEAYINYVADFMGRKLESTNNYDGILGTEGFCPVEYFKPAKESTNITSFYVKVQDENKNDEYIPLYNTERVNVTECFELVDAQIKGGDGWIMPVPTLDEYDDSKTILYVKVENAEEDGSDSTDEPEVSEPSDIEEGDSTKKEPKYDYRQITLGEYYVMLYANKEFMGRCYTNGYMYYPIAIQHNIDSNTFRRSTLETLSTGDFGSVRNHWYGIKITGINSVGCPVHDINQEIIPNPEPELPGLEVEVDIIDWHLITIKSDI